MADVFLRRGVTMLIMRRLGYVGSRGERLDDGRCVCADILFVASYYETLITNEWRP